MIKQYQMKKIWITFSTSIKSLMNLNPNFQLQFISYPYDQNKLWPIREFSKELKRKLKRARSTR